MTSSTFIYLYSSPSLYIFFINKQESDIDSAIWEREMNFLFIDELSLWNRDISSVPLTHISEFSVNL